MSHETNTIEAQLTRGAPQLTNELRDEMWLAIEQKTREYKPIPSPYYPFVSITSNYTRMTALFVALIIILGGGGTALAADAARPGDLLFPLDRALEDVRLNLSTSDAARTEYLRQLSEERIRELRAVLDEALVAPEASTATTSLEVSPSTGTTSLQIEADVFTDTTVVKLELNDRKQYFTTDAQTRDAVIAAVLERFPTLTRELVDERLSFEVEDRASRPKDRGVTLSPSEGEARVTSVVEEVLRFMDASELSDEAQAYLLGALVSELSGVTQVSSDGTTVRFGSEEARVLFRSQEDGDSRLEVRDGAYRVRIEEKDGEIRIRTKSEDDRSDDDSRGRSDDDSDGRRGRDDSQDRSDSSDDDRFDSDDRSSSDDRDRSSTSDASTTLGSSALQIEADVFTDLTTVKVERNDGTSVFTTSARTREAVAAEVAARYSIPLTTVLAVLDFELEDRASRPDDRADGDDDDRSGRDDDDRGGSSDDDSSSSGKGSDDSRDDDRNDDSNSDDDSGHNSGKDDRSDSDDDDSSGKDDRDDSDDDRDSSGKGGR